MHEHTLSFARLRSIAANLAYSGRQAGMRAQRPDGPPDLDELWRDFNRRLSNLFGRRGANGPDGNRPERQPDGRSAIFAALAVLGIVILLWLGSGLFIVQEGQQAVVLQFGKYNTTVGAGLNWRFPYPIQSHEIVKVSQLQSVEIGNNSVVRATGLKESSMLTEDENIIDVRFAVQYRIKDPKEYLFNNRSVNDTVVQVAETAVREIVGNSKMDTVLYEGREQVSQKLASLIQRILDRYKAGVLITNVTMQNVQPPEQVQAAFDDAVKAGQDRERLKNEGQAYANDVIPRARGTASRLIQEAEGYSARVLATAQGDSQRFKAVLAEYKSAPAVMRDRMYIDTMQQVLSNVTKVYVDTRQGNSLLYLPLDKLLQQSAAESVQKPAVAAGSAPEAPASAAANTSVDNRTRDALRSRDRDSR